MSVRPDIHARLDELEEWVRQVQHEVTVLRERAPVPPQRLTPAVLARLDRLDTWLGQVQSEVQLLRARAVTEEPARPGWDRVSERRPEAEPVTEPAAPPRREERAQPRWQEPAAQAREEPASTRFRPSFSFELGDLFGAKVLAWAGGIVTLLGVVFFFVLAVNRGWIGPVARVSLGGAASALVFGSGLWLRQRYGNLYSALAAVGAGLAGGYATLLAATALYDLLPQSIALVVAAAIAATGVAVSLAWEEEIVAGLGLLGAMVMPALVALQGGLSKVGVGFVALVLAGTAVVALARRWRMLLVLGAAVSLAQIASLVAQAQPLDATVIVLAGIFWLLYLVAGIGSELRFGRPGLDWSAASFVVGGIVFAGLSAAHLFEGQVGGVDQAGLALLATSLVYALPGVFFFRNEEHRDLGALLIAVSLSMSAIGVGVLLSGASLALVWAAEAAALAWLATRTAEVRFQVSAIAYTLLSLGHALILDAPPERLFVAARHPGAGAPALVAAAAGLFALALFARAVGWRESPREGVFALFAPLLDGLARRQALVRGAALAVGSLVAAYALSLCLLELAEGLWSARGAVAAFHRGEVIVTGIWSLAGLVAIVVGTRRKVHPLVDGAFVWLTLVLFKVFAYDVLSMPTDLHATSLLLVGGALVLGAYVFELADERLEALSPITIGASLVALGCLLGGSVSLVEGTWARLDLQGLVALAVAGLYALLALPVFGRPRHRDLSTLLWGLALAVAAGAETRLVHDGWLALVWAASGAALVLLAAATEERRLEVASAVYLALGTLAAVSLEVPPRNLVLANGHPGAGLWSLGAAIAAILVYARYGTRLREALWIDGVLAVYASALGILELFERFGPGDVKADFQRGHTAVSSFLGLLGLVLLYAGLKRRMTGLRVGGFALFGFSLGKIFLYDLPALSSVTRALSFLAVGAVLLLGGFFYQRLSTSSAPPADA